MGAIIDKQPGQPLDNEPHNKEAKTNDIPNSFVMVTIRQLTVNVFFDGTGNNMFNTKLRLEENLTPKQQQLQKELAAEVSFNNYYSNVALLYMAVTKVPTSIANVYIQGAGTYQEVKDSRWYKGDLGLSGGRGDSGVLARVADFASIQKIVRDTGTNRITLNVFGFSRGSFYARYFCAMAKVTEQEIQAEQEQFKQDMQTAAAIGAVMAQGFYPIDSSGRKLLALSNKQITINLVGLYDTVSSEGINHYDDVKSYRLNIGKKQRIARLVHLTVQNDYRYHFPLTRIDTAINDHIGFECSFPGAHSDVGGSYTANYPDEKYISVFNDNDPLDPPKQGEINWRWLREMGYYQGDPTSADKSQWGDFKVVSGTGPAIGAYAYQHVYVKRTVPYNNYQFVLANVMKQLINQFAPSLTFQGIRCDELENGIASINNHPILTKLNTYATAYVKQHARYSGSYQVDLEAAGLSTAEQQQLYHDFLHNSLAPRDLTANKGNDYRQGTPPRCNIIHDNV